MYTRSYDNESRINIPENYDGNAFSGEERDMVGDECTEPFEKTADFQPILTFC